MLHLYKKLKQNKKEILYFENLDEFLKKIKEIFLPCDLILIKGSNNLFLWKIIDFFKDKDFCIFPINLPVLIVHKMYFVLYQNPM